MSDLTAREYLASLTPPLAKAGTRGKFSKVAHEALEAAKASGMTFADVKPAVVAKAPKAPKPAKVAKVDLTEADVPAPARESIVDWSASMPAVPPIVRPQVTMYAVSDNGGTTARIGYDRCFRPGCFQTVARCACPQGPKPPANATPVASYPSA